jgi:hypothetical protein
MPVVSGSVTDESVTSVIRSRTAVMRILQRSTD